MRLHQTLETMTCARQRLVRVQKTGFVMQGQNQAMDFKRQLGLVDFGTQMPFIARLRHSAAQGLHPDIDRSGQRITNRSGSVVKLDCT